MGEIEFSKAHESNELPTSIFKNRMLLEAFNFTDEQMNEFIEWDALSNPSANLVKRLILEKFDHPLEDWEFGFSLIALKNVEIQELCDLKHVGEQRREQFFRELRMLKSGEPIRISRNEKNKNCSLREVAGISESVFDNAFVPWSALGTKATKVLLRIILNSQRGSTGTYAEGFQVKDLDQLTVKSIENKKGFGAATLGSVIEALRIWKSDMSVMAPAPSVERDDVVNALSKVNDFNFDPPTLLIYDVDDELAHYLKKYKIESALFLADFLQNNIDVDRVVLMRYEGRLLEFAKQLSARSRQFALVTFREVFQSAMEDPSERFVENIESKYGFSKAQLAVVFPQFVRSAVAIRLRIKGRTLQEIGDKLGVTRERARQLIQLGSSYLDEENRERVLQAKKIIREAVGREEKSSVERVTQALGVFICMHPGVSSKELETNLQLSQSEIRHLAPKELRKFISGSAEKNVKEVSRWTDSQLLESIKIAGTFHYPLSTPQYNELVRIGEVSGPSSQLIAKRFGTWKNACRDAGVEPTQMGKHEYAHKWSSAELVDFMVEYLLDPNSSGSFGDYEHWRDVQIRAVPSSAHMRHEMHSWRAAQNLALAKISELGPLDPEIYWPSHPSHEASVV